MSQSDINYILFETGNDAPWESDGIEFVPGGDFVIHRGCYEGTYRYKFGGIISDTETDAYHLIQWGMARRKRYSLVKAWPSTGIELCGDALVVRNICDAASSRKRGYIVSVDSRYCAVNKYYLLANNMAVAKGDTVYKEMSLADIDFSAHDAPWPEDEIFFIDGAWSIVKGTVSGMYVVTRGMTRRNWRKADLLANNMAKPLSERRNYYFASFLAEKSTIAPFDIGLLRQAVIDEFATEESEIVFESSFCIESLFDLIVCYDCLKEKRVPDNKRDQIRIPTYTPQQIAVLDDVIAKLDSLLAKCDRAENDIMQSYNRCVDKLNQCNVQGILGSSDYNTWKNEFSLDAQPRFARFYLRAVQNERYWQNLLAALSRAETDFAAAKEEVKKWCSDTEKVITGIAFDFSKIVMPTVGPKARMRRAKELLDRFNAHGLFAFNREKKQQIDAQLRQKEIDLGFAARIRKEQQMLSVRQEKYNSLKQIVNKLPRFRHGKKHKPLSKTLLLLCKDVRIKPVDNARMTVDDRQWSMNDCYLVEIILDKQTTQFVAFNEVLLYLGLVEYKQ